MELGPGDTFERYTIESLIGQGGMGRVYRAHDQRLRRRVALKLLHAAPGAPAVARLLHEARAAAALDHPGAVAIYDVGEVDGLPFIAMEYVVGRPLRALVGDPAVPLAERLRWLRDIARVLAVAHAAGIVHRDIKPENVMIRRDGAVKVLDFGIAQRQDDDPDDDDDDDLASLTAEDDDEVTFEQSGICGTPAYMAPEQVQGRAIDARADQFAWGVLAYELLSGALPWHSNRDGMTTRLAVVTERPAKLSPLLNIPAHIITAVDRALEKDPARRYPAISDLLTALDPRKPPRTARAALADDTPCIGRDHELAALRALIADGKRLITLVGPPGVGKTRLARAAARDLTTPEFAAVHLVDLADADTLPDVVHAVARTLGASMSITLHGAGLDPLIALLAGQGRALLVLDGADRIAARHPGALTDLLARTPALTLLLTSRERLHVRGEHALDLAPLPTDGPDSPAVALFLERARAVRPAYHPDGDELTRVLELVRLLDGLPLAIELAAARMTILDTRGLLDRLGRPGLLARDRGVDAAIDASWSLLGPAERDVLARCSVFRGGFDLDAAESVVHPGDETTDILSTLARLRDRSLLAAREAEGSGKLRLFLYLPIREFAAARLPPAALHDATRRHARWYAARATLLADAARDTASAAALAALALERDNLRAIRERLLATLDTSRPTNPDLATSDLARPTTNPDLVDTHDPPDAPELLARTLLSLDPLEHAGGALLDHHQALERALATRLLPALRARLLVAAARTLAALGRPADAIDLLADSHDPDAHLLLATLHAPTAPDRARTHVDAAHAARQPLLAARADLLLAALERHAGHLPAALALTQRARTASRRLGARVDEGQAALDLARLRAALGDTDDAARLAADAVDALATAADPRLHLAARITHAALALDLGRNAEARAVLEDSQTAARRLGDRTAESAALAALADLHLDDDDLDHAETTARAALPITDDLHARARLLWTLTLVAWDRNDLPAARAHSDHALTCLRADTPNPKNHAHAPDPALLTHPSATRALHLATRGALESALGSPTAAADAFTDLRPLLPDPASLLDHHAAVLALAFEPLRRARDLAARAHPDAAAHLARARTALARALAPHPTVALVRRSALVRALARRLHRALSPRDRTLAWTEALAPDPRHLLHDPAARLLRLPHTAAWIDLPTPHGHRLLTALLDNNDHGPLDLDQLADLGVTDLSRELAALTVAGLAHLVDVSPAGYALASSLSVLTIPGAP